MKKCNDNNSNDSVIIRKPSWLKIKLHNNEEFAKVAKIVSDNALHTICSSGKCPNMAECWSRGTATFMIMGDICTRKCKFCATKTGRPMPLDVNEPQKLARSIKLMKLKHAVVTSVDRDDLSDGGAEHWANCVKAIKSLVPSTTIELLIPDFDANTSLVGVVVQAGADIVGHNIETVKRLTPLVRSRAKYETSMSVIKYLSSCGVNSKSGIMVGLGETKEEVFETLCDMREAGCRIVTVGQYLRPTLEHLPVNRYVTPEEFKEYEEYAYKIGFDYAACGALVRSSYMAENALVKTKVDLRSL